MSLRSELRAQTVRELALARGALRAAQTDPTALPSEIRSLRATVSRLEDDLASLKEAK